MAVVRKQIIIVLGFIPYGKKTKTCCRKRDTCSERPEFDLGRLRIIPFEVNETGSWKRSLINFFYFLSLQLFTRRIEIRHANYTPKFRFFCFNKMILFQRRMLSMVFVLNLENGPVE